MERRSIRKVPYKRLVKSKLINTDMSEFLFAYAKMINSKLIENYQNKDELLTSENNNFFSQEEIIDYFQTLAEDAESFECIKFHLSSLQEFMSFPQEVWVLSLLYQTKITQKFNFPLINSNWKRVLFSSIKFSLKIVKIDDDISQPWEGMLNSNGFKFEDPEDLGSLIEFDCLEYWNSLKELKKYANTFQNSVWSYDYRKIMKLSKTSRSLFNKKEEFNPYIFRSERIENIDLDELDLNKHSMV